MVIHTVRPGDSLLTIAKQYNISALKIADDNDLSNLDRFVVGQSLVILPNYIRYTAQQRESLYSISRKHNTTMQDIIFQNWSLINSTKIHSGQILNIPQEKKLGTIEVNGYALPNIKLDILEKTLPYLTYLSIFSYEVRSDGSFKEIDDVNLIRLAKSRRVAPLMVISNMDKKGEFNSLIARNILQNKAIQETLINNVIRILKDKKYYGLDVNFEFIYPSDRELYISFFRNINDRLSDLKYQTTVALAPKISADQQGLLHGAHDYPRIGNIAKNAIVMAYKWGDNYGVPMAISPLDEVKRVLDYATSEIPSKNILMGIPNYGYDWNLDYIRGNRATTVTNTGAVELALAQNADIQFDNKSKAPYFNYYDRNRLRHVVWFEDARSIYNKLALVNQYGLSGISYWNINNFFKQGYAILGSIYNIKKVL